MKPAREWDEAYALLLPLGEFDWLEVKGRRALDLTMPSVKEGEVLETMAKAVSALANSGGGQLVYGLTNPSATAGKWNVDDGGISTAVKGKSDTREWLEDVIPNLVEFPLSRFNVYTILPTSTNSLLLPGRAIYIIDVADSAEAPHQSRYDKVYYARIAGKSRPLGHRLVSDIMGRRQHPKIELEFNIVRKFFKGQPKRNDILSGIVAPSIDFLGRSQAPTEDVYKYKLNVRARNNGRVFAQYANCFIRLPVDIAPEYEMYHVATDQIEQIKGEFYLRYYKENTTRDYIGLQGMTRQYGPVRYEPILPQLSHLWSINLSNNIDMKKTGALEVRWETFADSSPAIEGSILLKDIQITDLKPPDYFNEDEN